MPAEQHVSRPNTAYDKGERAKTRRFVNVIVVTPHRPLGPWRPPASFVTALAVQPQDNTLQLTESRRCYCTAPPHE